ncbi:hypothetical protein HMPREF1986_00666 [Oribacterium sp. oral taxon 078 str. F0263]|uniref:hypothetical protein n=1 Tax=Oribacterium sp. oral taxon 078 TaxID=652706 RepID=UPI0003ADCB1B|nr:hypothetical protein [Oribacterium sp. oral taxon 078]ERL22326.1 hypothetical protein HMPREF1986_00666 [Oribacterium sp. oral taxon 078 str. F0263]
MKETDRQKELDRKIENIKKKMSVNRDECNRLTEQLEELLDEWYPERREENLKEALYKAYQESGMSLDELLDILNDDKDLSFT